MHTLHRLKYNYKKNQTKIKLNREKNSKKTFHHFHLHHSWARKGFMDSWHAGTGSSTEEGNIGGKWFPGGHQHLHRQHHWEPSSTTHLDELREQLQKDSMCARVMLLCEEGWLVIPSAMRNDVSAWRSSGSGEVQMVSTAVTVVAWHKSAAEWAGPHLPNKLQREAERGATDAVTLPGQTMADVGG